MRNIQKGVAVTITLPQSAITKPGDENWTALDETGAILMEDENGLPLEFDDITDVYLTVFGENGKPLLDLNNLPLEALRLAFLNGDYFTSIYVNASTPEQYIRLHFYSPDLQIAEIYAPEDARLVARSPESVIELVPTQYFIDFVIAAAQKMDEAFQIATDSFILNNRKALQSYLISAQGDLERATKLYFTERTIENERRDYFFDRFPSHLWQFTVLNPPLNKVLSFKLVYANLPIVEVAEKFLVTDRLMGMIEFVPAPGGDSAGLYSMLLGSLNGLGLTLFGSQSNMERVPGMFTVSYTTGLIYDGCDLMEKESIRQAVARKALSKILPIIDPGVRTPSRTEGIDGVTTTLSYSPDKLIQIFQKEEESFINDLMMKYSTSVSCVVV